MVTLTGSLSSPGAGAWPVVGVALMGEMVRGEDARGNAKVGPGKRTASGRRMVKLYSDTVLCFDTGFIVDTASGDFLTNKQHKSSDFQTNLFVKMVGGWTDS